VYHSFSAWLLCCLLPASDQAQTTFGRLNGQFSSVVSLLAAFQGPTSAPPTQTLVAVDVAVDVAVAADIEPPKAAAQAVAEHVGAARALSTRQVAAGIAAAEVFVHIDLAVVDIADMQAGSSHGTSDCCCGGGYGCTGCGGMAGYCSCSPGGYWSVGIAAAAVGITADICEG
jgi:hypothetical protein